MKNIILLSKNYEQYSSGYYHQDIVNSFMANSNCFIYGPGYSNYDKNDSIYDVINKSYFDIKKVDYIVTSTSWDDDTSNDNVDPHPRISLDDIFIKKIYFLNKEYKKLELRFKYIQENKFDYVCTVHPDAKIWEKQLGIKFIYLPFGIDLERFSYDGSSKDLDFVFTGGLHKTHTDLRYIVKKEIFKNKFIECKSNKGISAFMKGNVLKEKYYKLNIFWAEWGSRNFCFKSMLPKGNKYAKLMSRSKVFLNTPSAIGIFNTRFFELMASKTLILCPKVPESYEFLVDGYNCIMFDPSCKDFFDTLCKAVQDSELRNKIVNNAYNDVQCHTYDERIKFLLNTVE